MRHGGIPAPLNYEGFPKSVCTSVNEVVCHGIPSEDEILKDGDIVNVDVSTIYNGYFSDSSRMFCIGNVSPEKEKTGPRNQRMCGNRYFQGKTMGTYWKYGSRCSYACT